MIRKAYAKINLTLEILGKRRDGYHDIKSVMHKIPFGDEVELILNDTGISTVSCSRRVCPDKDNLALIAAKRYLDLYNAKTEKNAGVHIQINKIVPSGAGLGGGSADGACVLDMLHAMLGVVSDGEVLEIARNVGSDVPFCLRSHTSAVCTGRGDRIRDIERLPSCPIIIAKPNDNLITSGIYGDYDKSFPDMNYKKDLSGKLEKALEKRELSEIAKYFGNDFERICTKRLPMIASLKMLMFHSGAIAAQMTGSGSAVFGLFDDERLCSECANELRSIGITQVYEFPDINAGI